MIDLAPLVGSRQLEDATRGLAVANRASSSSVADYIDSAAGHGVMLEFVTWDGPEHGRDFGEALNRLLMPGKIHLTAVGLTSSTL